MKKSSIQPKHPRKKRKPKRGRGGHRGHNAGHGDKGQKSRSGGSRGARAGFEGGKKSFVRRTHKLRGQGARKIRRKYTNELTVTIAMLDKLFVDGAEISMITLREKGLLNPKHTGAKIVLGGETKKKFKVTGLKMSAGVKKIIG